MPLRPYVCAHCGFWQRYFATPPSCPVCSDVRNALPDDGWRFLGVDEVAGATDCRWEPVADRVTCFVNEPAVGIGGRGYLIEHPAGNVAFEGAGFYTEGALDEIERRGGIAFLAASHPHGFGALWQLQDRFEPEVVAFHRDAIPFTKAFRVNWPFDDRLPLAPGAVLHHVGGHYEGQSVLHWEPGQLLFSGDTLKIDFDAAGRPDALSCHKAFHQRIPLSHGEVRHYREVLGALDFTSVCTPFEHAAGVTRAAALRLFEAQLAGRPFVEPIGLTAP